MAKSSAQTSGGKRPAEGASFKTRPLDVSTWDAFAELVERNNGVYGGLAEAHLGLGDRDASLVEQRAAHAAFQRLGAEPGAAASATRLHELA
jgi:hypothetical protein